MKYLYTRFSQFICAFTGILAITLLCSCSGRYPVNYEPDSMFVDDEEPSVAHLYDLNGRYMVTGQFIDNCKDKPILSQSDEDLAQCRFKTDVSLYPSGVTAMRIKVAKARKALTSNQAYSLVNEAPKSYPSRQSNLSIVTDLPPLTLTASSARRLALVVGNSNYYNLPLLNNPGNDATLIANTLKQVGFELIGGKALLDLNKAGLEDSVKDFSRQLHDKDNHPPGGLVALFYYAGHGFQIGGVNYLVPIDASPTKEADLDFQMIDVNMLLRQMKSAKTSLNLVVLDACRNNPMGSRGLRSASNGLAEMRAPEGTLIAFATQSGDVALDGPQGENSPFAKSLAWGILQPNLDQFGTFNAVALNVKKITNGAQQPWTSNSPIEGKFYFTSP